MKRLLLCISAGIISALVLIQLYRYFVQPELLFYKKADAITTLHEQTLRSSGQPCFVLAGGSEAKASLIPSVMQKEAGIAVINTATAAGNGLEVNVSVGLQHLQAGDTMILSINGVEEGSISATPSGKKFLAATYGLNAFSNSITPFQPSTILTLLSSDAGSMMITPIRKFTRGYAFIYEKESTLHPDGWMQVHRGGMQNAALRKTIGQDLIVSPVCRDLLLKTRKECQKKNADFIVMLSVQFSNHYETKRRLMHALQITRMGIPVLKDERLGLSTNNKLFADMFLHMNAEGAKWNSRIIARLIKDKSYWTEQEILNKMQQMGFTEDDTPQQPRTETASISTP